MFAMLIPFRDSERIFCVLPAVELIFLATKSKLKLTKSFGLCGNKRLSVSAESNESLRQSSNKLLLAIKA
jgi:hypothetical protein